MFIIDEIFNGTNTIERMGAAKAVLSAINKLAKVLATTYPDIEGIFDLNLRPGISTQRNDIRVLERIGIPSKIVGQALATVAQQSGMNSYNWPGMVGGL